MLLREANMNEHVVRTVTCTGNTKDSVQEAPISHLVGPPPDSKNTVQAIQGYCITGLTGLVIMCDVVYRVLHLLLKLNHQSKQIQKHVKSGVAGEKEITPGHARSHEHLAKVYVAQPGLQQDTPFFPSHFTIQDSCIQRMSCWGRFTDLSFSRQVNGAISRTFTGYRFSGGVRSGTRPPASPSLPSR